MTRPRYTLFARHARAGVSALAVLSVGLASWPYTVDDAFIVARYASHIATGRGYAMNPPQASDGVTGPLWLLPEVLASALGVDPIPCAKIVGLACAVLACWLLVTRLVHRQRGRSAALAAAVVLALSPSLGTWAVAGLETGAATLIATLAALGATRRRQPSGWALGACIAALAWLRPELALFSAALLVSLALRDRRAGMRATLLATLGTAGVLVFRFVCFGDLLPLSYRAKAGSLAFGLHYTLEALVLSSSLVGLCLVWVAARHGRRADRAVAVACAAHLLAVALAGGDWMPGYRLLVPVLPLYAALCGVGFASLARRRAWLAVALLGLACSVPALDLATRIPELRETAQSRARLREFADQLRRQCRVVALVDVGYLGYASGVEVVDLGGLTDARIAHMPGGHLAKRIDEAYLRERRPDAFVLHSASAPDVTADGRLRAFAGFDVERRVAALPLLRDGFRVARIVHYAPGYEYILLLPIDRLEHVPQRSRATVPEP